MGGSPFSVPEERRLTTSPEMKKESRPFFTASSEMKKENGPFLTASPQLQGRKDLGYTSTNSSSSSATFALEASFFSLPVP